VVVEEKEKRRYVMKMKKLWMEAVAFAAKAHDGQMRKDGKTPYVSHCFRVCMVLRDVFEVSDEEMLAAAVLHDTIEDRGVDFDDINKEFGLKVADLVSKLSKDTRLQNEIREEAYFKQLKEASDEVKLTKLADVYDNLIDSQNAGSEAFVKKTAAKAASYLENFSGCNNEDVLNAMDVVSELMKKLEPVVLAKKMEVDHEG
jgi:guanosine-3',5'-bis(diphosphate) 3'-pyrophosphohydrolase